MMGVQGLTIYHIKSHLQKYRLAKYLPDPSSDDVGNGAERKESGDSPSMDNSSGTQITEALKLQMEVQKRLHEQLEVQRQLQLRIEAQGNYLKKIMEEQQRLSGTLVTGEETARATNTEPSTPAPTSKTPLVEKEFLHSSLDDSFHEPLTPDSSSHIESPKNGRPAKKQRMSMTSSTTSSNNQSQMVLPHSILESSGFSGEQKFGGHSPSGKDRV